MLDIIYAVTGYVSNPMLYSVSLYAIAIDSSGELSIQKIDLQGESDIKKGKFLQNKGCVGITLHNGFQCYARSGTQRVDNVSSINWGAKSTPIIGLFRNKEEAKQCFSSTDLRTWDSRFMKSTEVILREIGVSVENRISLDENLARAIREGNLLELLNRPV